MRLTVPKVRREAWSARSLPIAEVRCPDGDARADDDLARGRTSGTQAVGVLGAAT
jgi:hypothetical protein